MQKPLPEAGSRVVFYSRFSTNLQNESSIEGQEKRCEQYADDRGWLVVDRFSDKGLSGTKIHGRDGLLAMRTAIREGEVDVVLVEGVDRLSRDPADLYKLSKEFQDNDVAFVTVRDGRVCELQLGVAAIHNSMFIRSNSDVCRRGQETVISDGRFSGSITYGYKKVFKLDKRDNPINGLREIHPERAAIVRRIHEEFDAGKSTFEICKDLNADGIPSPKGGTWGPGVLLGNKAGNAGILRNTIYIGQYHFRKTSRKDVEGKVKMKFTSVKDRIVQDRPEMRIVPQELWDRNQQRLAANFDRPLHKKKKNYFAFTGKVRCGQCGEPCLCSGGKYLCIGHRGKGVCNNSRRVFRNLVEDAIYDRLKEALLETVELEPCIDAYREEVEKARKEARVICQSAQGQLDSINRELTNLIRQLAGMQENSFAAKVIKTEIEELGKNRPCW